MGKLSWYYNRLKAMNLREVAWRIGQKRLQWEERKRFEPVSVNVGNEIFNGRLQDLAFKPECLGINFANSHYGIETGIHLLKGPDLCRWPDTFSYFLDYKQRDDLGDARTNWEKNRYYDWVLLAKAYYVSKDEKYFNELNKKVADWCEANPFLRGISWTSAMEFAIRSINWMYTLAFLSKSCSDDNEEYCRLSEKFRNGIINITDYLTKHYSRFSSANNHLLVEACAIGLAGYAFKHKPWQQLASCILTEELTKQNYQDGVNKELSLHYQTFGMEAYLLIAHVAQKNKDDCWKVWIQMLKKEAEFVAHSCWKEKAVCEFGDDDEGKILDLQGGEWHQWKYVLQLASMVTGVRYSNFEQICENIHWLFTEEEIENVRKLTLYDNTYSRTFKTGGNTFLRDKEDRVLIGIDHAALGFGSIAAHGHADALSFQMLVDGIAVFTDPGTFVYHCWIDERDKFRKTVNHNTLCLVNAEGQYKDQSQMLGAFLWGQKAECTLIEHKQSEEADMLVACHDGYKPNIHQRNFKWNKRNRVLTIEDALKSETPYVVTFMLGTKVKVETQEDDSVVLTIPTGKIGLRFNNQDSVVVEDAEISMEYGVKTPTKAIRVYAHGTKLLSQIEIKL